SGWTTIPSPDSPPGRRGLPSEHPRSCRRAPRPGDADRRTRGASPPICCHGCSSSIVSGVAHEDVGVPAGQLRVLRPCHGGLAPTGGEHRSLVTDDYYVARRRATERASRDEAEGRLTTRTLLARGGRRAAIFGTRTYQPGRECRRARRAVRRR